MSRFVQPDVKVLKISRGDTLTVKRRLNSGEQRAMFARMTVTRDDGTPRVNVLNIGITKILAYLVDWSLTDDTGKLVDIRDQAPETVQGALDALDADSYSEILKAIEAHDEAVDAEMAQEKNGQGGATVLPAISPSPFDAAGDTSGHAI